MHGNRFFTSLLVLPALVSPFLIQAPAEAQSRVTGKVVGEKGQPLSQVFVQQQGSLATTFSDDQGRFTLTVDPNGRRSIELSAVGYLSKVVSLDALSARPVQLEVLPTYQPTYAPVLPERLSTPTPLMDTQVGFSYQLRDLRLAHRGQAVKGWIDNELAAHGQLRAGNALLGLEGSRYKVPMTLPNTQTSTKVATPEGTDMKLHGGLVFGNSAWEVAPSLSVFQQNLTAGNSDIPYSGTLMDFTQTRRGVGLAVPGIIALGRVEVLGEAAWYPWTTLTLEGAPYTVASSNRLDLKLGVGYRVQPSIRAELTFARQAWRGGFQETSDVWGLGITYRPERTEDRQ
jgi:hypothetical protein